jgi:hypothetical protein
VSPVQPNIANIQLQGRIAKLTRQLEEIKQALLIMQGRESKLMKEKNTLVEELVKIKSDFQKDKENDKNNNSIV